jgi:DNA-directed RNA polymerase subunit RPC12/RpoP
MRYRCDNCGAEAEEEDLPEAKDLSQRLDEGGTYTSKECKECGALSYPISDDEDEDNKPGVESGAYVGEEPFPGDLGSQLIATTLHDRGFDEVVERMQAYDGDFWMDFVGPMIDRVEDLLYDDEERAAING